MARLIKSVKIPKKDLSKVGVGHGTNRTLPSIENLQALIGRAAADAADFALRSAFSKEGFPRIFFEIDDKRRLKIGFGVAVISKSDDWVFFEVKFSEIVDQFAEECSEDIDRLAEILDHESRRLRKRRPTPINHNLLKDEPDYVHRLMALNKSRRNEQPPTSCA